MTKGMVSEIRSFSTHDGPGIRTSVFLKGCPLRCKWCSSPETWGSAPQIYFFAKKCKQCGECEKACPEEAITMGEGRIIRNKCTSCMRCVEACPYGALQKVGEEMTAEEVAKKVKEDSPFFQRSGGGMTVSGGEPLAQPEFTAEIMKLCQEAGIHTCLDTCAYADPEVVKQVIQYADLVLISLKHMDPQRHRELTGVSNELILDNVRLIAKEKPVRISLPLIPGVNDDEENIRQTVEFAQSCGIQHVDIEPYHKLGLAKYEALGMRSPYDEFGDLAEEKVAQAIEIVKSYGLETTRGRAIK